MRPLLWSYPDDPAVAEMTTQWFDGEHMMAAPVLSQDNISSVYLPAGHGARDLSALVANYSRCKSISRLLAASPLLYPSIRYVWLDARCLLVAPSLTLVPCVLRPNTEGHGTSSTAPPHTLVQPPLQTTTLHWTAPQCLSGPVGLSHWVRLSNTSACCRAALWRCKYIQAQTARCSSSSV